MFHINRRKVENDTEYISERQVARKEDEEGEACASSL